MTTKVETINWPGRSGQNYRYFVYPIGTSFKDVPGNYVFAKRTYNGSLVPIYVGQTGNLSERFDNHHKMLCILRNGASHICVHESSTSVAVRMAEEQDIIVRWSPPCNG